MNSVKLSVEECDIPTVSRSRGPYERFTPEEKARIGKRAAEWEFQTALRQISRVSLTSAHFTSNVATSCYEQITSC